MTFHIDPIFYMWVCALHNCSLWHRAPFICARCILPLHCPQVWQFILAFKKVIIVRPTCAYFSVGFTWKKVEMQFTNSSHNRLINFRMMTCWCLRITCCPLDISSNITAFVFSVHLSHVPSEFKFLPSWSHFQAIFSVLLLLAVLFLCSAQHIIDSAMVSRGHLGTVWQRN